MKSFYLGFILCVCLSAHVFAQEGYIISGTIKDKKEVLPGASVYVSGYKIATVTNGDGKFSLPKLAPGNYDILIQMIGYNPYSKNIIISDKAIDVTITLTENTTFLKEVVIKPDPNRAYYLALFKEYFIGKSPNAAQCKILNTNVLNFYDDKETRTVTTTASDFLIIENVALGYRIKYLLESFEYDYKTKIIYYAGHPHFEELSGSKAKKKKWLRNREIAYNGSIQHFFKSLYHNTIAENGFVINKLGTIPNTNRKPDSLINANIKRLTAGKQGLVNSLTFNGDDSLSYWIKQRNLPKTFNTVNRADVLIDTLVKRQDKDLKMIKFKDALYIIYKNETEDSAYTHSGHKQNRPLDVGNFQISVLSLIEPSISFYANGGVYSPKSSLYSGYWAYEKMADMVPMEYR
ncbi:carboxypeptidase-like regulatory domain-containing protein [Pedobacter insulae]|uniref:CarboxypepD_reg-like domain-containing protein n=1 Tax=Pedobacter insulae TaxID=414048 RepID=A0A1I2XUP1_9SPHI|nr:carboxypeptidase-like regulatory domain-containing protein [Pedobacter insulae]SFH16436.1 CarboxypepD_reg-like domain-containing protein [Pedobacter insulae]